MKSSFRKAYFTLSRSLNPNPNPSLVFICHFLPPRTVSFPLPLLVSHSQNEPFRSCCSTICFSSSMAGGDSHLLSSAHSLENQFKDLRALLEESGGLRDRIRAVVVEIESTGRLMQASLLFVHQSRPVAEVMEESKSKIGVLKERYNQLAEIVRGCPGQYYRYHGDWRSETQTVVSLLAFMHWLETGNLLLHSEAEEKLGLNNSEFDLDIEDYLIGL
uniref:Translin n=1 Tax=Rhizophora mucronata TaxID=61149 RepID=A0A2P2K6F2_RHIMU